MKNLAVFLASFSLLISQALFGAELPTPDEKFPEAWTKDTDITCTTAENMRLRTEVYVQELSEGTGKIFSIVSKNGLPIFQTTEMVADGLSVGVHIDVLSGDQVLSFKSSDDAFNPSTVDAATEKAFGLSYEEFSSCLNSSEPTPQN